MKLLPPKNECVQNDFWSTTGSLTLHAACFCLRLCCYFGCLAPGFSPLTQFFGRDPKPRPKHNLLASRAHGLDPSMWNMMRGGLQQRGGKNGHSQPPHSRWRVNKTKDLYYTLQMRFSCAHRQPSLGLCHVQGWAWQYWGQAGLNHCCVGSVKASWSPRAGWWKNLSQSPAWRSPLFWGLGRIKGGCWWLRGFNSVTLSLIIMRQIQSSQTLTVQDGIGLSIIRGWREQSKCKGAGGSIGMWRQKQPSNFNRTSKLKLKHTEQTTPSCMHIHFIIFSSNCLFHQ